MTFYQFNELNEMVQDETLLDKVIFAILIL